MKLLEISLRTKFEDSYHNEVTVYTAPQETRDNRYVTQVFGGLRNGLVYYSTGISKARLTHRRAIDYAGKIKIQNINEVQNELGK